MYCKHTDRYKDECGVFGIFGTEEASVMMVELDIKNIQRAIKILKTKRENKKCVLNIVNDYNLNNISEKVLRIIHSYTDYINKKVWKKY